MDILAQMLKDLQDLQNTEMICEVGNHERFERLFSNLKKINPIKGYCYDCKHNITVSREYDVDGDIRIDNVQECEIMDISISQNGYCYCFKEKK